MKRSTSTLKVACATLAALFLAVGCSSEESVDDALEEKSSSGAVLDTVTLEATNFVEYIDLTGVTEPIRSATLSPEVAGRITTYNLDEGQAVKKGETLLKVDTRQAGAQIAELDAQIDQAELDIARTERLIERGLSSSRELEQLRTQRESLAQSKRSAQVGVGNSRLRAPFSGTVLEESSELGEYASPGQVVARIGNLETIKIVAHLPERQIRYVKKGDLADVIVPALDKSFKGEIVRIGSESSSRSRSFPIEIHIDNEDGEIRSGMRADVLLSKSVHENAIVVPRDVLRQGSKGTEAVTIADGKAEVHTVELGTAYGRYIVVHGGLNVGDELVIRGQRDLIAGESLEARSEGPCCSEQLDEARRKSGLLPITNADEDVEEDVEEGDDEAALNVD